MSMLWGIYVGVPAVTAVICGGLAYWIATRHAAVRGSRWFVATLALIVGWMLAEMAHLGAADALLATADAAGADARFVAKIFATKFAVLAFLANTVFYSRYSRTDFHRHPLAAVSIVVVFAVTLLPTWQDPFQSLVYQNADPGPKTPFTYVVFEPGILYALTAILVALLMGYALVTVVRYMLATPRRSGLQLGCLVVGSLSIMAAIALGNMEIVFPLDGKTHAEFGALPAAAFITVAMFRFRLFEMRPVARNALVEDLRDPVVVVDPDRRIVDYNPASAEVWPTLRGSTGESIDEVCPGLATRLSLSADVDDAGDDDVVDTPDRSRQFSKVVDGTRRYYSLTASTVRRDHGGEPGLYAVLLRDVTDLEQSRWQLERQNERLEQVAATISHDLRNPISVADGYAEMLADLLAADELDTDERDRAREHLRRVQGAHDRMIEIIEDVLALAREGQAVEQTEWVSLSAVARDAWSQVSTAGGTLAVESDRRLAADRSKFQTLLENLFRNAVEHGSTSPRSSSTHEDAVEHASEDVTVTVGPLDDGFFVADDGPGIPPEYREEVFEYGYTTSEDGTGLGLSIVRTIAESHGWTVGIDEDADGARFVFRNVSAATTTEDAAVSADEAAGEAPAVPEEVG